MNHSTFSFRSFGQSSLSTPSSRRTRLAAFGLTLAIATLLVGIDQRTGGTFLRQTQPSAEERTTLARQFAPLPDKPQTVSTSRDAV